jgi:hypothetical protein
MLAEVTAQILHRIFVGDLSLEQVRGLYHVTSSGAASWFGFAEAIRSISQADCELIPIATSEYPAPARRPAYSVLDTGKFRETFGLVLPDWRQSLELCMADLNQRNCDPAHDQGGRPTTAPEAAKRQSQFPKRGADLTALGRRDGPALQA